MKETESVLTEQPYNKDLANTARIVFALRVILRTEQTINDTSVISMAWDILRKSGLVHNDILLGIPQELMVLVNSDLSTQHLV